MGGLDPADDPAAFAVEVGEPTHPVALETRWKVEAGMPSLGRPGGPDRAGGAAAARRSDAPPGRASWSGTVGDGSSGPRGRRPLRPGSAATTCGRSGGRSAWTQRRRRPASRLRSVAQPESTLWGEWSITVHGEPPVVVWVCRQLHTASGAHFIWGSPRQQGPWVEQLVIRACSAIPGRSGSTVSPCMRQAVAAAEYWSVIASFARKVHRLARYLGGHSEDRVPVNKPGQCPGFHF